MGAANIRAPVRPILAKLRLCAAAAAPLIPLSASAQPVDEPAAPASTAGEAAPAGDVAPGPTQDRASLEGQVPKTMVQEPATPPPPVRKRAPRSLGLWLGYAWTPVNKLPLREDGTAARAHGASLVIDYLWQVGGLQPGGWPAYVGFILGFNYFPGLAPQRHALVFEYGIVVRHTLATHLKVYPYLGYGLGAVQAVVFGASGRGIGHLTRLAVGFEGKVAKKVRLAFEVVYKIDPIRAFGVGTADPPRYDFHTLSGLFGINFNL